MAEEDKKIAIALPGEWALQKAFGPALTEIGEDLKKLYAKGRDKIISTAYKKIPNPDDGKQANLRVTRDVLWNGAFTEDEVCAEHFGGILAASRSDDGKDDEAIQFADVIKSMSSRQLRLHYAIYHALNRQLLAAGKPVNVAQSSEIQAQSVWFAYRELHALGLRTDTDLNILHRQGLTSTRPTFTSLAIRPWNMRRQTPQPSVFSSTRWRTTDFPTGVLSARSISAASQTSPLQSSSRRA